MAFELIHVLTEESSELRGERAAGEPSSRALPEHGGTLVRGGSGWCIASDKSFRTLWNAMLKDWRVTIWITCREKELFSPCINLDEAQLERSKGFQQGEERARGAQLHGCGRFV